MPIATFESNRSKGRHRPSAPPRRLQCLHLQELFACVSILAVGSFCFSLMLRPAAAAGISANAVSVNPITGNDNPGCNLESPCKSISYAVQVVGASVVSLSAGIFNEPTVNIIGMASLVISGAQFETVFDCSARQPSRMTTGAAFNVFNSAVTITGVTFQNCSTSENGGAVSASGSSILVSQCSFINCNAASGGAISVTGPGVGLFLDIQSSNFTGNSANGGLFGCPQDSALPCSTWGGAIAAFEMLNVSIRGCIMVSNRANALVPIDSGQSQKSRNAVAGGGCVSVLFYGNASGSAVHISDNSFTECAVQVLDTGKVTVGNGVYMMLKHRRSLQ